MAAKSSPAAAEPGICFICTRAHKYTIRPDQDTRYIDCISYADICVHIPEATSLCGWVGLCNVQDQTRNAPRVLPVVAEP